MQQLNFSQTSTRADRGCSQLRVPNGSKRTKSVHAEVLEFHALEAIAPPRVRGVVRGVCEDQAAENNSRHGNHSSHGKHHPDLSSSLVKDAGNGHNFHDLRLKRREQRQRAKWTSDGNLSRTNIQEACHWASSCPQLNDSLAASCSLRGERWDASSDH